MKENPIERRLVREVCHIKELNTHTLTDTHTHIYTLTHTSFRECSWLTQKNEKMNKSKTHFLLSSNFRTPYSSREVLEIGFLAGRKQQEQQQQPHGKELAQEEAEQTQSNRECRQLLS